jgi:predicted HicB family RNase H-like nuclease
MKHKGYTGSVEFDPDGRVFHGRILGITADIITFQGTTVDELEQDFREAVDDYLDLCAQDGVEPQRPYSGRFVLRLEPSLHGRVTAAARRQKTSINKWIAAAVQMRLDAENATRGSDVDEQLSDAAGG